MKSFYSICSRSVVTRSLLGHVPVVDHRLASVDAFRWFKKPFPQSCRTNQDLQKHVKDADRCPTSPGRALFFEPSADICQGCLNRCNCNVWFDPCLCRQQFINLSCVSFSSLSIFVSSPRCMASITTSPLLRIADTARNADTCLAGSDLQSTPATTTTLPSDSRTISDESSQSTLETGNRSRPSAHAQKHYDQSTIAAASPVKAINEFEKIPELEWKTMRRIFLCAAVPMIGFGLMDQFVMIRAGEFIDATIGVTFGLATLAAAAVGQLCSDTCGVLFGSTLDSAVQKMGLTPPDVCAAQRQLLSFRFCTIIGAVAGIIIGCLLGMSQLFFVDLDRADRLKKQKELDTIFEMVMSDGPKLFHCQRGALFMYDKTKDEIWSKAVFGLDQAIRLQKNKSKSFTTWVLENKEILNCPDAHEDSRFNPVYDQKYRYKTRSVLAAPIVDSKGEVMAVLMFINKHEAYGAVFTEDDERMLEMMCKHIQIFMEKFSYGAAEDKHMISIREDADLHQFHEGGGTDIISARSARSFKISQEEKNFRSNSDAAGEKEHKSGITKIMTEECSHGEKRMGTEMNELFESSALPSSCQQDPILLRRVSLSAVGTSAPARKNSSFFSFLKRPEAARWGLLWLLVNAGDNPSSSPDFSEEAGIKARTHTGKAFLKNSTEQYRRDREFSATQNESPFYLPDIASHVGFYSIKYNTHAGDGENASISHFLPEEESTLEKKDGTNRSGESTSNISINGETSPKPPYWNPQYPHLYDYQHNLTGKIVEVNRGDDSS
ncbi:GAF domain-containing protein [Cardiosporidium cionae]|uniref:GAF domain-containing protein n=1 Tax=Cardiosporidium cionae TaxID=476202 RepID=A0ABQ7J9A3_9APIC|nr:GAF domain-containing protein [Cardiosporidium cionae]|eukprot:KAF8820514.1 GAF domain-containing protein [Cardiosporidium cionae]